MVTIYYISLVLQHYRALLSTSLSITCEIDIRSHTSAIIIITMRRFTTLLITSLASLLLRFDISTFAFQAAISPTQSSLPCQRRSSRRSDNLSTITSTRLYQSELQEADYNEEEEELIEFFVSPEQISVLRKEANKRDKTNKLVKFFLPQEESLELSEQSMNEISALFEKSELVEVRGVSKGEKKGVFDAAYAMAEVLEDEFGKPVVVVEIKGFAVRLYCPCLDDEGDASKRIKLFTSYRPGQWTRKPKPLRNAYGQIITDENGKSIKEIPEY